MTDWDELTERTLEELRTAPPTYRPTNFWGPGVKALLADLHTEGLARFKSWPTAGIWFNPLYGDGGELEAQRDFDVAGVVWDQRRWPFDLTGRGESLIGEPPQAYGVSPVEGVTHGRAYLNYLLCLAALSRHVDAPPRSFLEIGGGFGVLGEIVLSRDPEARYVDVDIPPLLTVASSYLTELFGEDRVRTYDPTLSAPGPIAVPRSAVLPSARIEDIDSELEVFVNAFSFQEMEPDVVDHYVETVCAKGIRYVVSLNSRLGKPRAQRPGEWGALEPITSADIVAMFARRGFEQVAEHDQPLIRSAGQVVVLRRD